MPVCYVFIDSRNRRQRKMIWHDYGGSCSVSACMQYEVWGQARRCFDWIALQNRKVQFKLLHLKSKKARNGMQDCKTPDR